jgi:hypothetical protein
MAYTIISSFLLALVSLSAADYPLINGYRPFDLGYTIDAYDRDFTLVGSPLHAVHESQRAPAGLALDTDSKLYLTYPRNSGPTPNNVVIATSFMDEEPWPSAAIQNCTTTQNASTCFINVQNVVLDSIGQLWIVDSGIPAAQKSWRLTRQLRSCSAHT